MKYGFIVWDPYYNIYSEHNESMQKQFLHFCLRRLGWNYLDVPSYTSRLALMKLPGLKCRQTILKIYPLCLT